MNPFIIKIKTCPVCKAFSTVSVRAFLRHVREHECFIPACEHPRKDYNFCDYALNQPFSCPIIGCTRKITGCVHLIYHIYYRHHCCKSCNRRNDRCVCFKDTPSHIQVGGGPIREVNPEVPAAGGDDNADNEEEQRAAAGENVLHPGENVHENIVIEPEEQRSGIAVPGPSQPRAPTLQRVDDDDRAAYLRIRDRWCPYCPLGFPDKDSCIRHCINAHPETCQHLQCLNVPDPLNLELTRSAIEDTYRIYEVDLNNVEVDDINALFISIRKKYKKLMKQMIKRYKNFKMQFRIKCQFFREDAGVITYAFVPMESFNFIVENASYANFAFNMALSNYNVRIEDFQENGSGWRFQRLNEFSILFSEYRPFIGSGRIDLPPFLYTKRGCLLNIPSDDNLCFLRCLTAAFFQDEVAHHKNRRQTLQNLHFYTIREKRTREKLNLDGIEFPFNIKQVEKFQRQNPSIGLNIFLYDEDPESAEYREGKELRIKTFADQKYVYDSLRRSIYPIKICKEKRKIDIDILYVQNGADGHYILIENLLTLMKYPHSHQKIICRYCLQTFDKMASTHEQYCAALGRMRTDLPEVARSILEFSKYMNMIPQLFLGAMDFESCLVPVNVVHGNSTKTKYHHASGYAWAVIDPDAKMVNSKEYVAFENDESVAEQMLKELLDEANNAAEQIEKWNEEGNKVAKTANSKAHPITPDEKCGFCNKRIFREDFKLKPDYVRHHQHYPPFEFEFYAHRGCNKDAITQRKLVVIAHNLRSYDSHFLIKACAKKSIDHKVEVIGTSSEKFFVVFVGKYLVFIDSLNFFSSSLEAVAKSMDKKTDFPISKEYFMKRYHDEEKVELMFRKGIYPYDYFTDVSKYDETELPPPEAFYDSLSKRPVDPEDYEHAKKVWTKLEVKDLREYTKIYNMSDVLLLLDSFQKLRRIFRESFGLDPAHYFSLPMLSWDCSLKSMKKPIHLITDPPMMYWLESAVRGGVASGLELRAAKANNPLLPDYDPKKPSSYIMVHDVNNLYGTALVTFQPYKGFKWLEEEEINEISKNPKDFIEQVPDEGETGYFLEVDMFFPEEIHEKLEGLTPAPYKRVVDYEELSPETQQVIPDLGISDSTMNAPRLLADLHPRKNYIVHYRVLKFYLSLGIQVTKVHKGISFLQQPILRDYINTLATMRSKAPTKFEQNMWKLAANSIYGKSVECTRNRSRFVIVKDRETALKFNRKPNVSQVILLDSEKEGEYIAIIRLKKLSVKLDKPIFLGITVLDESKRILYDWYYNYAKPKYGDKLLTLATDTDSVISLIETENIWKDMYEDREHYDMSDYDETHPFWKQYYCGENRKSLGKMKDELANKTINSFVFLRPKMYMYDAVSANGVDLDGNNKFVVDEIKKAKGLPRQTVKDQLKMSHYIEALEKPVQNVVQCTTIRSDKHELYTTVLNKRGLSAFEQKRYVLPDGISTLPFGHKLITHEDNMPRAKQPRLDEEMDINL